MAALHARGQHRIERCLSHVGEAITRGDPTAFSRHPDFRFLQSHFVFPADPQPQPQQAPSAITLGLIDPVELPD
jgi:hypothetical protein